MKLKVPEYYRPHYVKKTRVRTTLLD